MESDLFALHAALEERHWWFVARRRILVRVAQRVVPPAGDKLVIDVGCGTGGNAAAFAQHYRCIGVDTSRAAIEFASRRYPPVAFLCGQVPEVVRDRIAGAELLLLTDVLEHVADDFTLLSTLLAEMRPGAHLLITVPADERLWSEHDVSFGHYRRYDRARLDRVWADLPVSVRLLSYFNARLYPIVRAVRSATHLIGRSSGRSGTDFRLPPPPANRALESIFAGEAERLVRAIDAPGALGYRRGVSLIAVLRREPGALVVRTRPATVPADRHTVA